MVLYLFSVYYLQTEIVN